ncbi:hypothetical protein [Lentzea sp. NBRC 102530]|nr:hypothetical protein [Lentzea sp. NBRC 102530]GLY47599.1 hypothetical protein Lesp01_12550 [Lentzea sp. NBRC 102530]
MTYPELTPEEMAFLASGNRGYQPGKDVAEPEEAPRGPAGPSRAPDED